MGDESPVAAGERAPSNPPARTIFTPQLTIQFRPVSVIFSGLTPGFTGLYQINAVVPPGLPARTLSASAIRSWAASTRSSRLVNFTQSELERFRWFRGSSRNKLDKDRE